MRTEEIKEIFEMDKDTANDVLDNMDTIDRLKRDIAVDIIRTEAKRVTGKKKIVISTAEKLYSAIVFHKNFHTIGHQDVNYLTDVFFEKKGNYVVGKKKTSYVLNEEGKYLITLINKALSKRGYDDMYEVKTEAPLINWDNWRVLYSKEELEALDFIPWSDMSTYNNSKDQRLAIHLTKLDKEMFEKVHHIDWAGRIARQRIKQESLGRTPDNQALIIMCLDDIEKYERYEYNFNTMFGLAIVDLLTLNFNEDGYPI